MQLTQLQKNQIQRLGKKYNLKLVLLHGSYAKGSQHKGSDIDIALLGKKPIVFAKLLKINLELEKILNHTLAGNIDISTLHKDDPLFRYEVAKTSKLLFGDELDYSEFRAYSFQSYFDAKDLFLLQRTMINKYQNHLNQTYA